MALGWAAYGVVTGFPAYWSIALQSITAIVAVIMLFTIQHVQARDQLVIHRKLDEVLRALPEADVRLIAAEEASDEHLEAFTEQHRQERRGGERSARHTLAMPHPGHEASDREGVGIPEH